VIQEEGEYELGSLKVYWWDLDADRMREAGLAAVEFSAAPNPDYVQEIPLPEEEAVEATVPEEGSWIDVVKQWAGPLGLVALVLAVGIQALRRLIPHLSKKIAERRKEYEESEAAAFDRVKSAARKGDTGVLIRYLYQWIDRILPGDRISTLGSLTGKDRQLDEQVAAICASRYSEGTVDGEWSGAALIRRLSKLNKGLSRVGHETDDGENHLPLLNP
jgi:hypothetical protein